MEGNLLRKENEFYKLNEQLELKAQKLMEEVEYVMKHPDLQKTTSEPSVSKARIVKGGTLFEDGLSKPPTGLSLKEHMQCPNTTIDKKTADNTDLLLSEHSNMCSKTVDNSASVNKQLAEIVSKLDSLPDAAKGIGPEAALHILRVKIQLLEQELETLRLELKNKTEMSKKSRLRFDQLEEDHERWHHQAENIQQLYQKQQSRLQEINGSLLQKDAENSSFLKEVECLRKELKQTCQSGASTKAKLNRCLDENGKLKSALSKLDTEEKELREVDRGETENSMAKINLLEKRKKDVIRGINTQLELVGNLKTQLVHMDVLLNIESVEERLSKCVKQNI